MKFQFTHPEWLLALPLAWAWVILWFAKSDVQIGAWRRWLALMVRLGVTLLVVMSIAGVQWMRPTEGVNVVFLLDRSDSIPSAQQEWSRNYVNQVSAAKKKEDRGGVLVFGSEAAIETSANTIVEVRKITAVVGTERTDIGAAVRLGTAAFPETGQKRLVLLSDGNENLGDALAAVQSSARPLGVTVDVVPLGVQRSNDVCVQKVSLPSLVKKGVTFDGKIFVQSDRAQPVMVRIYRNEQPLGEHEVQLTAGKNLFTFPQTLGEEGFYTYSVYVDAVGDNIPQNNQANGFTSVVRGEPLVLVVTGDANPEADRELIAALSTSKLAIKSISVNKFPGTLAELQHYDALFISNVAAGDLGEDLMRLIESAVRDFGLGLVCVGGDQTYAAGGYRGTPLESVLPVSMELDSKKVLPSGAVALVMHGMEFDNGNQVARDCALGVLDALGPQDEMGVVLWDGNERWLFPMTKVGDKRDLGKKIAGMNQGDLPSFQGVMTMASLGLKKSTANLKHMIVFSDGDPGPPSDPLMNDIVAAKMTVSTVLISGHSGPEAMIRIANLGRGRFYPVQNAAQLPQIFIKEAAVILKSAIFEDPFTPKLVAQSELLRGINAFPPLLGYVCTTPKPRAELPLISDKGDPVLAHWQFGLGRAVAFTSDAKAKWAKNWLGWQQYRQFWVQAAQWSLRRLENADFTTDVTVENGEGLVNVEALDDKGNYRNFLSLQTVVVSPKGHQQTVRLEQTGPGHYEARFPTKEVGTYLLNLMELKAGKVAGSQVVGASVNYSPEFSAPEPNLNLLRRIAEANRGKVLDPLSLADNPFLHDRHNTYQPRDWWEWLLKLALILFVLDVAVRRILLERQQLQKAWVMGKRAVLFWRGVPRPAEADESLAALLARRDQVRAETPGAGAEVRPELFQPQQVVEVPAPQQAAAAAPIAQPAVEPSKPEGQPATTTSRLLEAKRKARKKLQ